MGNWWLTSQYTVTMGYPIFRQTHMQYLLCCHPSTFLHLIHDHFSRCIAADGHQQLTCAHLPKPRNQLLVTIKCWAHWNRTRGLMWKCTGIHVLYMRVCVTISTEIWRKNTVGPREFDQNQSNVQKNTRKSLRLVISCDAADFGICPIRWVEALSPNLSSRQPSTTSTGPLQRTWRVTSQLSWESRACGTLQLGLCQMSGLCVVRWWREWQPGFLSPAAAKAVSSQAVAGPITQNLAS